MTAIVSNTGPLIALERVGRLDLLGALFDAIFIPESVEQEFLAGESDAQRFLDAIRSGLIHVAPLATRLDPLLRGMLDEGEASVIQLAQERGIARVLIDERKGRKVARDIYGLLAVGTIRVLLDAKQAGLLDSIRGPLLEMRQQGYHIHENIVRAALLQAGEIH